MGRFRHALRARYYGVLGRTFATDDGRTIVTDALGGLVDRVRRVEFGRDVPAVPYPDLGRAEPADRPSDRADVIIITGRFRSGSTLLWNLFRHIPDCTAYYEPFNERRWFDQPQGARGTDPSHRNVSDYWREYQGLETLGALYRQEWTFRRLLMGEEAWDPGMKAYVEALIAASPGRPVLQFNRIDFRLPWFRRHFPNARIIHIYRHPRDQWCSTLMGDLGRLPRDLGIAEFGPHDRFYLRLWAADLKHHFPFLDERVAAHPYRLFYSLWRLSHIMGVRHGDHSVPFEPLVSEPAAQVPAVLEAAGVRDDGVDHLRDLIVRPKLGRWTEYAGDDWFAEHEAACERMIGDFLG